MGIVSMFRVPKPRHFKYTPIFYDPVKEDIKAREQQIKQELGLTEEGAARVSGIKGQIRRQLRSSKRPTATYNLRLFVIIGALVLLAYYIFYY